MNGNGWINTVPMPRSMTDPHEIRAFMDNLDRPGYLWDPGQIKEVIQGLQGETLDRPLTFAARVFFEGTSVQAVRDWYEDVYGPGIKREIIEKIPAGGQTSASELPA